MTLTLRQYKVIEECYGAKMPGLYNNWYFACTLEELCCVVVKKLLKRDPRLIWSEKGMCLLPQPIMEKLFIVDTFKRRFYSPTRTRVPIPDVILDVEPDEGGYMRPFREKGKYIVSFLEPYARIFEQYGIYMKPAYDIVGDQEDVGWSVHMYDDPLQEIAIHLGVNLRENESVDENGNILNVLVCSIGEKEYRFEYIEDVIKLLYRKLKSIPFVIPYSNHSVIFTEKRGEVIVSIKRERSKSIVFSDYDWRFGQIPLCLEYDNLVRVASFISQRITGTKVINFPSELHNLRLSFFTKQVWNQKVTILVVQIPAFRCFFCGGSPRYTFGGSFSACATCAVEIHPDVLPKLQCLESEYTTFRNTFSRTNLISFPQKKNLL